MPRAFRATVFHCLDDPGADNSPTAVESFDDGLLIVDNGRIAEVGPAADLLQRIPADTPVEDFTGKIIVPVTQKNPKEMTAM